MHALQRLAALAALIIAPFAAAGATADRRDAAEAGAAAPRVLFVLTSHGTLGDSGRRTGYYLSEVTHPLAVFREAGFEVTFASVQGGEPPVDGLDLDDPVNARFWSDPVFRAEIAATTAIAAVDARVFDVVYFPGGHGTMWDFPGNPQVQRVVREAWDAGGVVAAVCHGPAALVDVRLADGRPLVAGRRLAAFTDDEERAVALDGTVPFLLASTLVARGAIHEAAPDFEPKVVVDGRLVTGQNPASATGLAEAVVAIVGARKRP